MRYNCFFAAAALSLVFTTAALAEEGQELLLPGMEVQLKDPLYIDGILSTEQGGVIRAPGFRLQAKHIQYIHKSSQEGKTVKILADGDLLLEYEGQYLAGERLEYDCIEHTGSLWEGRVQDGIWFVGGKQIDLKADGSLLIHNAFITTCESQENLWQIHAQSVKVLPSHRIHASEIRMEFFHIPVLWLPSFKTSTKFVSDPPIRYRLVWDRGLGPRATLRYRVFSYNDLELFARVDYRLDKGFGGAIETEYFPEGGQTTCVTRSYAAHDKVVSDETTNHRYRLQGVFTHISLDEKTKTLLTYDKLSDLKMISDFPSSDFTIDTQNRTQFTIHHREDTFQGSFLVEPRLNPFESINQKLPFIRLGIKPFSLGETNILSENRATAGYLNYVYASDLLRSHPSLREIHSARASMQNKLYRPCFLGPLQFTPSLGLYTLLYSNNQQGKSAGQLALMYEGRLSAPFQKFLTKGKHLIEPYLDYEGISKPLSSLSDHYIFMLDDGLYQINSLKFGIYNLFTFVEHRLSCNLYGYHFFASPTLHAPIPKAYLLASFDAPSYRMEEHTCWNFEEGVLDFCNVLGEYTINENLACILEFRHRSYFDWRKADHENFLVDMARSIHALLDSPLSDGRNTFLAKIQVQLSPKWQCHFTSHYGWGRATEPAYTSFKIDTITLLSCRWQLKFSYTHTTNDDRFAMQMQLCK